jgi:hypothetical protein
MSHILPLTADEVERRLLKIEDLAIHSAVAHDNIIRVDLNHFIENGSGIKFKAPVNCTEVTRLQVVYPSDTGDTTAKTFTFADANGNDVGEISNLFAADAIVKVLLDTDANAAFVQNADTNAYLEEQFADIRDKVNNTVAVQLVTWEADD